MSEAGPLDLIDDEDSDREDIALPGVLKGIILTRSYILSPVCTCKELKLQSS